MGSGDHATAIAEFRLANGFRRGGWPSADCVVEFCVGAGRGGAAPGLFIRQQDLIKRIRRGFVDVRHLQCLAVGPSGVVIVGGENHRTIRHHLVQNF